MKKLIFAISSSILIFGCSATNPKLQAPPVPGATATAVSAGVAEVEPPKVDVLIVEDISDSMTKNQQNFSDNIDKLVSGIAKNGLIDWHIGVTSIFDSVHYTVDGKWKGLDGKMTDARGRPYVDVLPLGQLYPVTEMAQDPNDKNKKLKKIRTDLPPYITKETPDYLNLLRSTLKIGISIGPQFEESFSPVQAALSEPMINGANKGFYRDDAYLVVIFLTDADDWSTNLAPEVFFNYLMDLKHTESNHELDKQKIIVEAAIVPSNEQSNCAHDPSGAPVHIETLLSGMMKSSVDLSDVKGEKSGPKNYVSLCDKNFGAKLAKFGSEVGTKVGRKVIDLGAIPDEKQEFTVWYGDQEIPKSIDKGWSSDLKDPQLIIISGNLELKPQPNAKITVHFTPANMQNLKNGRTTIIGAGLPPTK